MTAAGPTLLGKGCCCSMGCGDGCGVTVLAGVSTRFLFGTPTMALFLTISTGVISRIEGSGLEMGVV